MGKGSKTQKTEVQLPPELMQAARDNLAIANEVAAIGYTPYQGPTIAGFTPMQRQAAGNIQSAASAFGMGGMPSVPNNVDPLTGIPLRNMDAQGNISGFNNFMQAKAQIPAAQRSMIDSFVTNPQTLAWPTNPAVPRPQFSPTSDPALMQSLPPQVQQMIARRSQIPTATPLYPGQPPVVPTAPAVTPYDQWRRQKEYTDRGR